MGSRKEDNVGAWAHELGKKFVDRTTASLGKKGRTSGTDADICCVSNIDTDPGK